MLHHHPSTKSFKSTFSTLRGSNVLAVNAKSGNNSAERYSSWPPILSEAQSQGRTRKISEASFSFHISPQFCQKRFFGCVLIPHITTLSMRKGTKKYSFVSQSSEKLRNRQSPKSKCILLSCSPAGGGGGACGGGGGGGQRGRGGKDNFPHCCSFPFSHRSSSY